MRLLAAPLAAVLGLGPWHAAAARVEAVEDEDLLGRAGLNGSLLRLPAEALQLRPGESEVIFLRHGWSLNNKFGDNKVKNVAAVGKVMAKNVFHDLVANMGIDYDPTKHWNSNSDSAFKAGYEMACDTFELCGDYSSSKSSMNWEISRWSRDSLLHPVDGEEEALRLGQLLHRLLPPSFISAVFVSPLRRTLQTALAAFGPFMMPTNSAVVPWLHERYKSQSDLGNDGPMNAVFLERYAQHLVRSRGAPDYSATVQALKNGLETLGADWVDNYGSVQPKLPQPERPIKTPSAATMRYYPTAGSSGYEEDKNSLAKRMVVLREFLKSLPPGGRYVLVSHGGVCEALFGHGKVENLALVTGRYFPGTADPRTPSFFHEVALARDRWQTPELAGWRAKKDD